MTRVRPWQFGACFVGCALLFTHLAITLVVGLTAWLIYLAVFRRDRRVIALLISTSLALVLAETAGRAIIEHRVGRTFNTDVDHRLKPNPAEGVNSDNIRCRVEASDFSDDTFNIILLGDSFVFGLYLEETETVPAHLERLYGERGKGQRVRVLNFGWPSSSPGPCYRLLVDIGAKYKPDLVVDVLDITDFFNDFESQSKRRYWNFSPTVHLIRSIGLESAMVDLRDAWRPRTWFGGGQIQGLPVPNNWQFVANQPLAHSLPYMRETEKYLRLINDHCRDVLHVPFVTVMIPRNFQYSDRECPDDPNRVYYTPLGPYVREPERWFQQLKTRVDFPCESLLSWFEESPVFPKCFPKDPHWVSAGCAVAAEGISRFLDARGLGPGITPTSAPANR